MASPRKKQLGRSVSIVGAGMSNFGAYKDKTNRDISVSYTHLTLPTILLV